MVKHSGPEPQENLLKEWESQPLLASIAKYTPNIAERPLTATKQVFGCWLSITQPTPCCKRRNHSLPTLKKPFPYKVHGSFFMSPMFLFLFLPFPLELPFFCFMWFTSWQTKKMAAKNPGVLRIFWVSVLPGKVRISKIWPKVWSLQLIFTYMKCSPK